jgi:hypothetical protein
VGWGFCVLMGVTCRKTYVLYICRYEYSRLSKAILPELSLEHFYVCRT